MTELTQDQYIKLDCLYEKLTSEGLIEYSTSSYNALRKGFEAGLQFAYNDEIDIANDKEIAYQNMISDYKQMVKDKAREICPPAFNVPVGANRTLRQIGQIKRDNAFKDAFKILEKKHIITGVDFRDLFPCL